MMWLGEELDSWSRAVRFVSKCRDCRRWTSGQQQSRYLALNAYLLHREAMHGEAIPDSQDIMRAESGG